MTAPTTRETADHADHIGDATTMIDHAELARLAEAASAHLAGPNLNTNGFGLQIWGDSFKGGRTHVLDVRGWGYLTGGGHGALGLSEDDGIAAQRAIQAYVVAAWNAVPTLLSEIAALRGERDHFEAEFRRQCGATADQMGLSERAAHELDAVSGAIGTVRFMDPPDGGDVPLSAQVRRMSSALTQAERQRDELRKALERAADDLRDIGGQSPRPSNSPDPEHENYLRRVLISLGQVGNTRARQALANQGADQ